MTPFKYTPLTIAIHDLLIERRVHIRPLHRESDYWRGHDDRLTNFRFGYDYLQSTVDGEEVRLPTRPQRPCIGEVFCEMNERTGKLVRGILLEGRGTTDIFTLASQEYPKLLANYTAEEAWREAEDAGFTSHQKSPGRRKGHLIPKNHIDAFWEEPYPLRYINVYTDRQGPPQGIGRVYLGEPPEEFAS